MADLKQANREPNEAMDIVGLLEINKDTRHITNSPLLRLPAELRKSIFLYATTADGGKVCVRDPGKDPVALFLPQVCRQLLAETETMCYANNTFCFLLDDKLADMSRWVAQRSAAQKLAIRQLEETMYSSDILPTPQNEKLGISRFDKSMTEEMRELCPNIEAVHVKLVSEIWPYTGW
ncbi:uncharacterized protein N0V89_012005 [Didymosphaeria variabile]|uniref:Uncharacterized protein n=1 Tax=Didymosphaeria variabile TaxID=1932322 RepID=A0A9W9C5W9_9PLEO|nr:uncharacterized protein N0V89_012005 [Didymosphaeria variabile]KAJ4345870.1 hypothetical protein N0V89_012005 [Didymosphaeria variabile]